MEVTAVCTGCGREAFDNDYWSVLGGEFYYWLDDCSHEWAPGDVVSCDCGIRCPVCQTADEREITHCSEVPGNGRPYRGVTVGYGPVETYEL